MYLPQIRCFKTTFLPSSLIVEINYGKRNAKQYVNTRTASCFGDSLQGYKHLSQATATPVCVENRLHTYQLKGHES